LDVSATCTGAVLVTVVGDVLEAVSWSEFRAPKDMRGAERCDWHLGKVQDFSPTTGPDLVVIEGYGCSGPRAFSLIARERSRSGSACCVSV